MQGRALFDRKKGSSPFEKGVSFFLLFRYYDSCSYVALFKKYVIKTICHYGILS